ncbi:putative protein FAR1-RELATED SEQUENCE 10 [Vicia villosa]|uniref:putative protein FAR1-RELATED SEQUENCE 10 n=1 Tax=Vicia villosa TaxID=3911 RepID=UPI00273ADAD3|nr:putative protein FAR1-RELATED SEQUENCE 10 [Vicia villosa]
MIGLWLDTMLDVSVAGHLHIAHFLQVLKGRMKRKKLCLIWLTTVWVIWNSRNNIIFNNSLLVLDDVIMSIKSVSWIWLSVVIDKDVEFEGGEYDDEDADEECEFEGGEYDDSDEDGEFDAGEYDDKSPSDGTNGEDHFLVDGVYDIAKMDMFNLQNVDVSKLQFRSLEVAYKFYCSHEMLKEKHYRLLAANRKLSKSDTMQIRNFGNAEIKVTQVIGSFANVVGDLRVKDPLMFVAHTVVADETMQNLFWSNGESQKKYELFGDVLAFDATYKKNKYMFPFVVFSGVNQHSQTIIFATAIVSNEVEGSYVWLLEQFLDAMKEHPNIMFYQIAANTEPTISNPNFIHNFKRCMLSDHDVWKFENLGNEMLDRFGLEEKN